MFKTVCIAAVIAGSLVSDSVVGQVRNPDSRDPAAYAVVLPAMSPKPSSRTIVVRATPLPIPRLKGSAPGWLAQFADVPRPLLDLVDEGELSDQPFDASSFPEHIQLVPEDTLKQFFTGHNVERNWLSLKQAFDTDGWLAFSEVLLTDDHLDALVYAEKHCGGLCGEGAYFWLQRDSRGASWRVARRMASWIS